MPLIVILNFLQNLGGAGNRYAKAVCVNWFHIDKELSKTSFIFSMKTICMSSFRKFRVDYTPKQECMFEIGLFFPCACILCWELNTTQRRQIHETNGSLVKKKNTSKFCDIWGLSEGYINTFLFLPCSLWHFGHSKCGYYWSMSDRMLRSWKLVYVNKVPESQTKIGKHSANANVFKFSHVPCGTEVVSYNWLCTLTQIALSTF